MEREVGGGIGMGNTCKPMAVSFQCMTKSTTIKKKKKKPIPHDWYRVSESINEIKDRKNLAQFNIHNTNM